MRGGGVFKKGRHPYGGVSELMTYDDRGEGGVKNCQNGGDVICGCPLRLLCLVDFNKKRF